MTSLLGNYTKFVLLLLMSALVFGILSSWAYLYPEAFNKSLPFYQLRPIHTSSALFFIISGGTLGILLYTKDVFVKTQLQSKLEKAFIITWCVTILSIFAAYAMKQFGGREYWEFPPLLAIPLLLSWTTLMITYFISWYKTKNIKPLYIWMWSTGIFFFFLTFIEQNLWQIPWFRQSVLRELTVQWKANGSMVGAWNQMIYGSSLFLMVKISGRAEIATDKKAFFFYFLGITNLMFNWGHHIYNLPTNSWIRHVSYIISMTEWLILISIIQGFKAKLTESRKLKHLVSYRFLLASEFWVFANLLLALFMSIPAVNRYTHGTHITVAHAMGTTIGINSMILLGVIGFAIKADDFNKAGRAMFNKAYYLTQISFGVFWLALITAGVLKGYRSSVLNIAQFQDVMNPVNIAITVFAVAGLFVAAGLFVIALMYWKMVNNCKENVKQFK
jgi:nitric oxide reductase subunit B